MAKSALFVVALSLAIGSTATATTLGPQDLPILIPQNLLTSQDLSVPRNFICPVGGKKFEARDFTVIATAIVFYNIDYWWGRRPDGRAYGPLPFFPLTECPGNGFVYFKDEYSKVEAAQLTSLVLAPDYQALRTSDSPFFRSWWLMSRTAQDPFDTSEMLLESSWDSDADPARKARYQRAFINNVRGLAWSEEKRSDWFWLNLRAANALRELGEFEVSTQLLTSLDQADRLPSDADDLKDARFLLDGLRPLNNEKNAAAEPANLIPAIEAARRCLKDGVSLTASEVKACQSDEIEKAKKTIQKHLDEIEAD